MSGTHFSRIFRITFRNIIFYFLFPLLLLWIGTFLGIRLVLPKQCGYVAVILVIISIFLEGWTSYTLLKFGGGGTSFSDPPSNLVSLGPYKVVRHPMYLGNILGLIGLSLLLNSFSFLACSIFIIIDIHLWVTKEEENLTSQYGQEYLAYTKKTPKFFPVLLPLMIKSLKP